MSDYRVLYYPDFTPDPTWLRQILMLSDGVVRIVPSDVKPNDPDDVVRLTGAIPGCLSTIPPIATDTAVAPGDEDRLAKVFALLGRTSAEHQAKIRVTISGGKIGIADHVFIHDSKLSYFVRSELERNGLVLESASGLAPDDFIVVRKDASDVILAGLAARIGNRTGLDTITDRPLSFAYGALRGVPPPATVEGSAEGALLSAIAEVAIPTAVASMELNQYREIRDSYEGIRQAFKTLTAEWAQVHRLTKVTDPETLAARVESAAQDFSRRYIEYRSSRFARAFNSWTPLCVGGVLTLASAVATPKFATGIAVGSVVVTMVERLLSTRGNSPDDQVFSMLSGLRRELISRSGIHEVI